MRWSWQLGTVAGIRIYVHLTFFLLLGWIGLTRLFGGGGLGGALVATGLVVLLFGIVVLHELGHALTARRFGIQTRDITLLPIGGVARLARLPDTPYQELVISAAGPAVNLGLATTAGGGLFLLAGLPPIAPVLLAEELMRWFLGANLILALFNLLPAFPMDGGRILRALLALRLGSLRATEIAVQVGQWMALLFGLAGLFVSPTLLLIALFVWLGGQAELALVRLQAWQRQAPAGVGGFPGRVVVVSFFYPTDPPYRVVRDVRVLPPGL